MKSKLIILIGPMATGKSNVANILANKIAIPRIPMDRVRWYYYLKDGFNIETEKALPSFRERMAYWKPFEVKAVHRIINEFAESIIDFGAGHSYYTDELQFIEVQEVLRPLPNVFLLLPSPDKERSLEICNKRLEEKNGCPLDKTEIEANRDFIFHSSNYRLAKHIIYSENKTPEDVATEVIRSLV